MFFAIKILSIMKQFSYISSLLMTDIMKKLFAAAVFAIILFIFVLPEKLILLENNGAVIEEPIEKAENLKKSIGHSLSLNEICKMLKKRNTLQRRKRLPDALIIGAKKSGTTFLRSVLELHPLIKTNSHGEIHYFDNERHYKMGLDWYLSQLPEVADDEIALEKSPKYFVTPEVPERVYNLKPEMKLILVVRQPVDRTISDYAHTLKWTLGSLPSISSSLLNYKTKMINQSSVLLSPSRYAYNLEKWLEYFPLKQFRIVDGEELLRTPWKIAQDIENFLNVTNYVTTANFVLNKATGFYCRKAFCATVSTCKNNIHVKPEVTQELTDKLKNYFQSQNGHFFSLINRTFAW